MTRPSNRAAIIEAALRVAERAGISALTHDSLAAESGLTKGGIIYHFPTKAELLRGIHEHLAEQWERQLDSRLTSTDAAPSASERLAAYVRVSAEIVSPGEYLFVTDAETTGVNVEPWQAVTERWTPPPPEPRADGSFDGAELRAAAAEQIIGSLRAE